MNTNDGDDIHYHGDNDNDYSDDVVAEMMLLGNMKKNTEMFMTQ